MFRTALFGLVSAAALISSANAADLGASSYKDGSYGPTWAGVYVGINGGYGLSANNSTIYAYANDPGVGATTTSATTDYDKSGGFGGGQIGYNFQRGRVVYGVEADIQGAGIGGSGSAFASAGGITSSPSRDSNLDWFGTVRGRVGYSYDRALFYFTAGFAYGGTHGSASMAMNDNGAPYNFTHNVSATQTGYVLGGGIEYALTPAWSVKGEYQYIDLGGENGYVGYHNAGGTVLARGYYTVDQTFNTVRLGLNYHLQSGFEPLK